MVRSLQMSWRRKLHNVDTLSTLARKAVERELGETANAINGRFSCGGAVAGGKPVKVAYETESGGLKQIVFPVVQQDDIKQLLDACSVASFGLGSETVTDPSYRDAYKLDSDCFIAGFNLCDTSILDEIAHTMVSDYNDDQVKRFSGSNMRYLRGNVKEVVLPSLPFKIYPELNLRAELYKLNVYCPGGHFKAHVDTPRSQQMFGSLVVCLPSQFSGGALVTRHRGVETVFDWSFPLEDRPAGQSVLLQWAAFFSDVEHEVLPVTAGYRVTLTYNLYYDRPPASAPILTVTNYPFYHQLRTSLASPYFMRGGGVLGFTAQHEYVFVKLNRANDLPLLLKGADRIVFLVAKSLGLSVLVKPVVPCHCGEPEFYDDDDDDKFFRILLSSFSEFSKCNPVDDREYLWDPIWDMFDAYKPKGITWCQVCGVAKVAGAVGAYGNESEVNLYYQGAAILIGVPKWGDQRKRYLEEETVSFSADETQDKELKARCFPPRAGDKRPRESSDEKDQDA